MKGFLCRGNATLSATILRNDDRRGRHCPPEITKHLKFFKKALDIPLVKCYSFIKLIPTMFIGIVVIFQKEKNIEKFNETNQEIKPILYANAAMLLIFNFKTRLDF